jgi:transposase-like protein
MKTTRTIALKPYSVTELAKIYGVCNRTFKKWVDDIPEVGQRTGRYYSIPQVKLIFENMKIPTNITVETEMQKADMDLV